MGTVRRVGIIGMGHVGAHVANVLLLQGIADELWLCEPRAGKLEAEVQDLGDSLSFCPQEVRLHPVGDASPPRAETASCRSRRPRRGTSCPRWRAPGSRASG